jgi:hypothetical protein
MISLFIASFQVSTKQTLLTKKLKWYITTEGGSVASIFRNCATFPTTQIRTFMKDMKSMISQGTPCFCLNTDQVMIQSADVKLQGIERKTLKTQ